MQERKNILLLGTGFVAHPTLTHLLRRPENHITVACRNLYKAQEFFRDIKDQSRVSAVALDVNDQQKLDEALESMQLVISLIPYIYHKQVIEAAVRMKVNVCTTSYVSPAMRSIEQSVKDAGIVVMNEIGIDPGVDHLYAVKTIHEAHQRGAKVKTFLSYCGGLPAPESSGNPLGYKFSWSSRGVLLALLNSAKYLKNGKIEEISSRDLMASAKPYFILPAFAFVAYPNRDSSPYREFYNMPEVETCIRGTLRYQGFPEFIKACVDCGLLSQKEEHFLMKPIPWREAFAILLKAAGSSNEQLRDAITSSTTFKSKEDEDRIISGLSWIGLLSDDSIIPRKTPLDTFCATLEQKCQYMEKERDMVCLQHKFIIENPDSSTEIRTSTLLEYGDRDGYSAMARLVGVPCGVASQLILDGVLSKPGVWAPYTPEINDPLIEELKKFGISCKEEIIA